MSSTYLDPHLARALRIAPSEASDAYYDYCLEPYRPRRPWVDKYRAENLLFHSLLVGGAELEPPLRALQATLGRDLTVWGVKWDGQQLWWELYFYDPRKEEPNATLTRLAATLSPWLTLTPRVDERWPYMMASFELDADTPRHGCVDAVNLYLTGERGHAGRSYIVDRDGPPALANTYRFLEAKRDVDDILALVKASVFVDWSRPETLAKVLIPELWACKKVCVAKKRACDAIYFSGIAVDQLVWFLRRFAYPPSLVDFVDRHRARFEHLYFDVGVDYRWDPASQRLVYLKSSYYGTL